MSGANSKPVFTARATELGISPDILAALQTANIDSFARLTYLTNYQPGQADDSTLFNKVQEIAGRELEDFEKSTVRQLFYEASAVTVGELRQRVERSDSSEPIQIPLVERMHRLENQKQRLVGVHFSVHSEPSNKLVDHYFQMMADKQLTWLPWEKLASKAHELQMNKKDMQLTFDTSGNLKMSKRSIEAECELKGEMQIRQALQRRSLAIDLTGMLQYGEAEKWHEKLFEALTRPAPQHYRQTSMEQCKEADKLLWTKLGEMTRGDVAQHADDTRPVQTAFVQLTSATDVLLLLQPLPAASSSSTKERPSPYPVQHREHSQLAAISEKAKVRKAKARANSPCRTDVLQPQMTILPSPFVSIGTGACANGPQQASGAIAGGTFVGKPNVSRPKRSRSARMTDK